MQYTYGKDSVQVQFGARDKKEEEKSHPS